MNYNKYIALAVFSGLILFGSCDLLRDNPLDGKNDENMKGGVTLKFDIYGVVADNNKDGIVNNGETVYLGVSLKNSGTSTAKAVKATFSTTSSYVSGLLPTSEVSFGDISAGNTKTGNYAFTTGNDGWSASYYAFKFTVSSSTPDNTQIPINISITDENGNAWTDSFNVPVTNSDGFEMVFVQGGTFTMGCTSEQSDDCSDLEKPAHSVTLSSFNIGRYEVTQAQWKAIMDNNPSYFIGDNLPVEMVSWNDVQEFIRQLNATTGKQYRLPTEAEWEYAARGGNKSSGYKYSGSNNVENVAWCSSNSGNTTHAVGTKQANELGIYDMGGNVWEWCSDWYGAYSASAQNNPTGPSSGSHRVDRGSSWGSNASYCRVVSRDGYPPGSSSRGLGFRLVVP